MDILLLFFLIVLNGLFSMSEIAIISSRRARLQRLADENWRGAKSALALNREPAIFLSTVQVGITTVGILSGAIGQNAFVDPMTAWLSGFPLLEPYASGLAMTLVVAGLTYFSVVVGELLPKQLGLLAPEKTASLIALPINILSALTRPLVWLLSASSSLLLRLLGATRQNEPPITDEEIRVLMAQGAEAGVFHRSEQAIVSNVLRLDEQLVGTIMTHRNDIYTLDLLGTDEEIRNRIAGSRYSRVIVCRGGLDHIEGVLRTTDIIKNLLAGKPLELEKYLRPPLYVPEGITTTRLLEHFRKSRHQSALIVDEYGELEGLVTLTDVLAAIVGDVPGNDSSAELDVVLRENGSWLMDGSVSIERMKTVIGMNSSLPGEGEGWFMTVGGLLMHQLDRVPVASDHFDYAGYRFEVVDMDKNRVDKVLVTQTPAAAMNLE